MKVIKINPGQFSKDGLRAGDLIALANFLEYIRKEVNDPEIRMWIPRESLRDVNHVYVMQNYFLDHTDYFVPKPATDDEVVNVHTHPGTDVTYPDLINLWNIRKDVTVIKQTVLTIPDAVQITNPLPRKQKLVIAPLVDAEYNTDRNWSRGFLQSLIARHGSLFNYPDGMIIAAKEVIPDINPGQFTYCFNYRKNLDHIVECSTYVGGDTGLSHFCGALKDHPPIVQYLYPKTTYGTTNPFHWMTTGGMVYY